MNRLTIPFPSDGGGVRLKQESSAACHAAENPSQPRPEYRYACEPNPNLRYADEIEKYPNCHALDHVSSTKSLPDLGVI
jgi:hypothetical protein